MDLFSCFNFPNLQDNMTKAASGLGVPTSRSVDSAETGGVSESSSMVDEVSEYCPKLTYQQVSCMSHYALLPYLLHIVDFQWKVNDGDEVF